MSFGSQMKSLRLQRGFIQEDLAKEIGISEQTISRWENDRIFPDALRFIELAFVLGVSPFALINDEITLKINNDGSNLGRKTKINSLNYLSESMGNLSVFMSNEERSDCIRIVARSLGKLKKVHETTKQIDDFNEGNRTHEEMAEMAETLAFEGYSNEEINHFLNRPQQ